LLSKIQRTAHRLFAERGFEAVTTEAIASAAAISISTRPPHESPVEALIQLLATHTSEVNSMRRLEVDPRCWSIPV
jgi:DNA-binding transcriptional regulator YbjK